MQESLAFASITSCELMTYEGRGEGGGGKRNIYTCAIDE